MAQNIEESEEIYNESFVDEPSDDNSQDFEEEVEKNSVAKLLAKLNSSGALVKKPVRPIHHCFTCVDDFDDIVDFHDHLIEHVSLPYIVIKRVDADDSDDNGEDDDWESDNENVPEISHKPMSIKSENLNLNKFLDRGGLTITSNKSSNNNALLSLKNIGNICIKKVPTVNDKDNFDSEEMSMSPTPEVPKAMESSGTLKLTIKHTGENNKAFHVVNGNQDIKSEKTNIENNRLAMAEPEDTKQGILNSLALPIKEEPMYPDENVSSSSGSQNNVVLGNVTVKSEASSRPQSPSDSSDASGNQIKVKEFAMQQSEKESQKSIIIPKPMIIPKVEAENIIEINCDSDKDDDEIIFIGSSELPGEKKPPVIVPKLEPFVPSAYSGQPASVASSANSTPTSISSNSHISTAKEHSFNWNAPQSKHSDSLEAMLSDKNADALFESLLSNHRKDDVSDIGPSEYISLDKLGPQHTCETCNTRFTSIERMENHKRITGHSNQLVVPTSNSMALSTYQQPGFLMNNVNSLLPVKQLAETVSKIASGSASNQYTHQQNITVNIQSYPGNQQHGQQPPGYNYPGMAASYQQPAYRMPNQTLHTPYPAQYPPQPYPNAYSQYPQPQPPMYNPMNNPYPPQPMQQQNYPQNQYPTHQSGGQLLSQYPTPIPGNNQNPPASTGPQVIPLSNTIDPSRMQSPQQNSTDAQNKSSIPGGIKIQSIQTINSPTASKPGVPRMMLQKNEIRGQIPMRGGMIRGGRGGGIRPGMSPMTKPGVKVAGQAVRGVRPGMIRGQMKRPAPSNGAMMSPSKKRMDMLIPDRHDNEDCQVGAQRVISMQNQRDGLPMIQSIQGSRDKTPAGVQLGNQLTVTKTRVRPPTPPASKDTSAMASILASRGIKITPKQKPNIPNLGSNISITSTRNTVNNFSLPDDSSDIPCNQCNKTFSNSGALAVHAAQAHQSTKVHRCDICPQSFSVFYQLVEHKKNFHNVSNAEIGIPVVELSQQNTIRKLMNLGINNFIPIGTREHGAFGIPIVSAQNALNGNLVTNLQQLGADGLLQIGPVKPLPKC